MICTIHYSGTMVSTFSLISSVLAIVVGSVEYNSINKGYTFNSTCRNSFECRGKLICLEDTCRCSVELIWNGTNCIMRQMAGMQCTSQIECQDDLHCVEETCSCHETHFLKDKQCIIKKQSNELCSTSEECLSTLVCHRQICQCISSDYWNGTTCKLRKTAGMPCSSQNECQDDFRCLNESCNCQVSEYLDADTCFRRKEYKSPCEATVQCKDTLKCFNEHCQCDKSNYWKGNVCVQRKRVDAACILSTDCYDNLKCSNGICVCNLDKAYWDGVACIYRPSECEDLNDTVDGVYPVYPGGNTRRTYVYCIMRDNKKWTVIQRRYDGTVNFYRDLYEYTRGFGIVYKEHWLGNMKIRRITQDGTHELSVHLEDWNGNQRQANYSQFSVGSKKLYTFSASGYSGTAGDSLKYHNGKSFYTKNKGSGCTKNWNNEVWYNNCQYSNLNGKYNGTGETGFVWNGFGSGSLKASMMLIRRRR
ncbi:uncharacterized protein LOC143082604 isoform X2 [Mytilus galloprovincialis]|uniref:uncharacterized protein LOC143082604 isoform X2 n=1 Tax=Mytilus galloprovincialis TaxID=29158 RepID=UPI003F7BF986